VEFPQARHYFLGEECDVRDRIFMVQETALAKHQQMAEAADAVKRSLGDARRAPFVTKYGIISYTRTSAPRSMSRNRQQANLRG
jgi:hypothetical protein